MNYTKLPLNGKFKVTQAYNEYNPKLYKYDSGYHKGIDMVSLAGDTNIYSIGFGRVQSIGKDEKGFGNYVVVRQRDNITVLYAHLSSILVRVDQDIIPYTKIGIMGSTGNSTGKHIHVQIKDLSGKYVNVAEYMGIPNKVGNYDYRNYIISTNSENWQVTAKIGANIREKASTSSKVIVAIPCGTTFEVKQKIQKTDYLWAKIKVRYLNKDYEGYMAISASSKKV